MEPGSPLVHKNMTSNILSHCKIRKGDVGEAFKECAVILENNFTTSSLDHMALETECSVAAMRGDGTIDVWGSSDHPFLTRANIARVLGMDVNAIHYSNKTIGGSFGSRKDSSFDVRQSYGSSCLCDKAACEDDLYQRRIDCSQGEAAFFCYLSQARSRPKGKLLACEIKIILDTGAYSAKGDDDWGVRTSRQCSPLVHMKYQM